MKIWIVSAGWDYEGEEVVAVCTTLELAEKAKAAVEAEDEQHDYCKIHSAETDVFSVMTWKDGSTTISDVGADPYIPIVEYQTIQAV